MCRGHNGKSEMRFEWIRIQSHCWVNNYRRASVAHLIRPLISTERGGLAGVNKKLMCWTREATGHTFKSALISGRCIHAPRAHSTQGKNSSILSPGTNKYIYVYKWKKVGSHTRMGKARVWIIITQHTSRGSCFLCFSALSLSALCICVCCWNYHRRVPRLSFRPECARRLWRLRRLFPRSSHYSLLWGCAHWPSPPSPDTRSF